MQRSWIYPVHPHVCGEHIITSIRSFRIVGSSPRVWGTRCLIGGVHFVFRFIPTCVGNTLPNHQTVLESSVHPHVCGEHSQYIAQVRMFSGSSPRVWGTREGEAVNLELDRFIPTCVGNTELQAFGRQGSAVHPHVCGEHYSIIYTPLFHIGSSPRVWGTLIVGP